eukprot:gnl/TRDRNA2_/TRDRNA2_122453_c0_seq1.p1 gnl/TRDRNA2_/TRDRNA2_122453_c0~~gnl/TRDRNA2_/TRDRNA2_122453_c0_seq1.p1  ORF type:complete len:148 (-),score=12.93 gnl/TRDRNA2_/TRDRNA2_122453_c0_seq1:185-628(-)
MLPKFPKAVFGTPENHTEHTIRNDVVNASWNGDMLPKFPKAVFGTPENHTEHTIRNDVVNASWNGDLQSNIPKIVYFTGLFEPARIVKHKEQQPLGRKVAFRYFEYMAREQSVKSISKELEKVGVDDARGAFTPLRPFPFRRMFVVP